MRPTGRTQPRSDWKYVMTSVSLVAVGAIGVMAGAATAAFTGLDLVTHVGTGWLENGYGETGLVTYRLWATFDGKDDDGILVVFGSPGAPMSANSWNGFFYNDVAYGGLTAPLDLTGRGIWTNQWDTYVTINAESSAGDATVLTAGFAEETNSLMSNWVTGSAAWVVTPGDDQSRARERPGGGLGVLLAQFSVDIQEGSGGQDLFGTINLLLRNNDQLEGLVFPAPGALALLGLAGLAGRRRRE